MAKPGSRRRVEQLLAIVQSATVPSPQGALVGLAPQTKLQAPQIEI